MIMVYTDQKKLLFGHFSRSRVSPSGGRGLGGIPPTVLTQKCRFCHFHAVFGNFAQIVPPPVDPIWETLRSAIKANLRLQHCSGSDGWRQCGKYHANTQEIDCLSCKDLDSLIGRKLEG